VLPAPLHHAMIIHTYSFRDTGLLFLRNSMFFPSFRHISVLY